MSEVWKPIPGYEGIYEASSLGRIRTAAGKVTWSGRFQCNRVWSQRVLKQKKTARNGGKMDARVHLYKDGVCSTVLVSRLVCAAFLGEPESGETVNHKDGNPMNNNIENLEYLSAADNIRHAFEEGLMPTCIKTTLVRADNGSEFGFRSMSMASSFLGRSPGYIHGCLSKGRPVVSSAGEAYLVRLGGG